MDATSTPRITDTNVYRLRQLQNDASQAFALHVSRHKADIARQEGYFKEKFSIIGADIRAIQKSAPETQKKSTEEDNNETQKEWIEMTPEHNDNGKKEASPNNQAEEKTRYASLSRDLRKERRHFRSLRKRSIANPEILKSVPVQTHEKLVETKGKPSTPPQAPCDPAASEEDKVLSEIEKFLQRKDTDPSPEPELKAAPLSAQKKRESSGFSLKGLFDFSPHFRNVETIEDPHNRNTTSKKLR